MSPPSFQETLDRLAHRGKSNTEPNLPNVPKARALSRCHEGIQISEHTTDMNHDRNAPCGKPYAVMPSAQIALGQVHLQFDEVYG